MLFSAYIFTKPISTKWGPFVKFEANSTCENTWDLTQFDPCSSLSQYTLLVNAYLLFFFVNNLVQVNDYFFVKNFENVEFTDQAT